MLVGQYKNTHSGMLKNDFCPEISTPVPVYSASYARTFSESCDVHFLQLID